MNGNMTDITADAMAIQEKDAFREQGWLKLIAPAKVNLHLGIGARRADGYHDAAFLLKYQILSVLESVKAAVLRL